MSERSLALQNTDAITFSCRTAAGVRAGFALLLAALVLFAAVEVNAQSVRPKIGRAHV